MVGKPKPAKCTKAGLGVQTRYQGGYFKNRQMKLVNNNHCHYHWQKFYLETLPHERD